MSEYRVNTDIMRKGAAIISKAATGISAIASRVNGLANQIGGEYQGQIREKIRPILGGLSGQGSQIQSQSEGLGTNLSSTAGEIDGVMQLSVASVSGAFTPDSISPITNFFKSLGEVGFIAAVLGWIHSGQHPPVTVTNSSSRSSPSTSPKVTSGDQQDILSVPFQSQWNGKNGGGNCGPASVTMAINKFGKNVKYDDVISKMPKDKHGYTDFQSTEVKGLLKENGLQEEQVHNMSELETHLKDGHPVIISVDNSKYDGNSELYPATSGFLQPHIVVITGVEKDASGKIIAVYINDPLAVKPGTNGTTIAAPDKGTNFRVPVNQFNEAAGQNWYAAAIEPIK